MTNRVHVSFKKDVENKGVVFPAGTDVPGVRSFEGVTVDDRAVSGEKHFFPWDELNEQYLRPDKESIATPAPSAPPAAAAPPAAPKKEGPQPFTLNKNVNLDGTDFAQGVLMVGLPTKKGIVYKDPSISSNDFVFKWNDVVEQDLKPKK